MTASCSPRHHETTAIKECESEEIYIVTTLWYVCVNEVFCNTGEGIHSYTFINGVYGGGGNDVLIGNDRGVSLGGGAGNDQLLGGNVEDLLR